MKTASALLLVLLAGFLLGCKKESSTEPQTTERHLIVNVSIGSRAIVFTSSNLLKSSITQQRVLARCGTNEPNQRGIYDATVLHVENGTDTLQVYVDGLFTNSRGQQNVPEPLSRAGGKIQTTTYAFNDTLCVGALYSSPTTGSYQSFYLAEKKDALGTCPSFYTYDNNAYIRIDSLKVSESLSSAAYGVGSFYFVLRKVGGTGTLLCSGSFSYQ